ncbi:MAG: hypothetical protein ABI183_10045 [Polyangiaceae bacterium]
MTIALLSLAACDLPDYQRRPEHGYLGSIDIDGPDVGKNHYGSDDSRNQCATDPNGETRFYFAVASRSVQVGKFRKTETQSGSVAVSAVGAEPRYEVDLPWSHMLFDAKTCSLNKIAASAGPQNIAAGIAQITCTDPERGDELKIDVSYQGC